jgi:4-amino-4-deoxy-L-arabinose transferase-like glycosyltransferase
VNIVFLAEPIRARRMIVALALAGVLLRLAFGLIYWVGKPLTHDEREYLALARNVAEGRGFMYDGMRDSGTTPQFGRAPGYPMFLASIGAGEPEGDSAPLRVKVAQALVGGAIVWIVGLLGWRARGPRAGVFAAAIAAAYPPLVWMPAYVFSETVYSLFALSAAFVLQLAVDRCDAAHTGIPIVRFVHGGVETGAPTIRPVHGGVESGRGGRPLALAAGALIGAAILIRPAMLFFVPVAVLWLLGRRRHVLAIAMLASAVAVVAPWTARNYRVHGRFVMIASEGGVTFWTGNHPLARGEGDLAANPEIKRAELVFREAHPGLTPEELEPLYYREALAHIAGHPGWWVVLLARKAFFTFVPVGPSYALHSRRYRVASIASYLLVLPFSVAGARQLWRHPNRPSALFLLAGSAVLVCLVFFPQERFRIPVIDPVLIVCAAAAMGRPRP